MKPLLIASLSVHTVLLILLLFGLGSCSEIGHSGLQTPKEPAQHKFLNEFALVESVETVRLRNAIHVRVNARSITTTNFFLIHLKLSSVTPFLASGLGPYQIMHEDSEGILLEAPSLDLMVLAPVLEPLPDTIHLWIVPRGIISDDKISSEKISELKLQASRLGVGHSITVELSQDQKRKMREPKVFSDLNEVERYSRASAR